MSNKENNNTNETTVKDEAEASSFKQFRGLYSKVNISVKTLNIIIVVASLAIVICILIGLKDRGYLIEFNTMGGSYIEPQKLMYGDEISVEEPSREGYRFEKWALDEGCKITADLDSLRVDGPFTLYACWIKE
ncbi:MAG: InlB B-repeat-containing protein [Erysipelotrichaceae bacterium]|nr:InlB B-repeat-containing protein [Erysipelotrichaceae bacterium]